MEQVKRGRKEDKRKTIRAGQTTRHRCIIEKRRETDIEKLQAEQGSASELLAGTSAFLLPAVMWGVPRSHLMSSEAISKWEGGKKGVGEG